LWLFGQFAAASSSQASYQQAEEPVGQLINDTGETPNCPDVEFTRTSPSKSFADSITLIVRSG
jgi:hypothetical protein